jgi:hypothetical protein
MKNPLELEDKKQYEYARFKETMYIFREKKKDRLINISRYLKHLKVHKNINRKLSKYSSIDDLIIINKDNLLELSNIRKTLIKGYKQDKIVLDKNN